MRPLVRSTNGGGKGIRPSYPDKHNKGCPRAAFVKIKIENKLLWENTQFFVSYTYLVDSYCKCCSTHIKAW